MPTEALDARTRAIRILESVLADRAKRTGAASTDSATDFPALIDAIEADLRAADRLSPTAAKY